MVIDNIFFYHFIDPGLKLEVIFRKKRKAENSEINFEVGDIEKANSGENAVGALPLFSQSLACLFFLAITLKN